MQILTYYGDITQQPTILREMMFHFLRIIVYHVLRKLLKVFWYSRTTDFYKKTITLFHATAYEFDLDSSIYF